MIRCVLPLLLLLAGCTTQQIDRGADASGNMAGKVVEGTIRFFGHAANKVGDIAGLDQPEDPDEERSDNDHHVCRAFVSDGDVAQFCERSWCRGVMTTEADQDLCSTIEHASTSGTGRFERSVATRPRIVGAPVYPGSRNVGRSQVPPPIIGRSTATGDFHSQPRVEIANAESRHDGVCEELFETTAQYVANSCPPHQRPECRLDLWEDVQVHCHCPEGKDQPSCLDGMLLDGDRIVAASVSP